MRSIRISAALGCAKPLARAAMASDAVIRQPAASRDAVPARGFAHRLRAKADPQARSTRRSVRCRRSADRRRAAEPSCCLRVEQSATRDGFTPQPRNGTSGGNAAGASSATANPVHFGPSPAGCENELPFPRQDLCQPSSRHQSGADRNAHTLWLNRTLPRSNAHSLSSSSPLTVAKATFASRRELSPQETITPLHCRKRSAAIPR